MAKPKPKPKSNLTPEQIKARNAEYKRNQRKREAIEPSTTDTQDEAQLKADVATYCARGRSMMVDIRNKISVALQDWEYEFGHDKALADKFTLDELVVDEILEAARLKAKAQAFYDDKIKPYKLSKSLQHELDDGIKGAKSFPAGPNKQPSEYAHLNDGLAKIIDSLPTEENLIEDLKKVCRDSYREKTCNGFYKKPSEWRKNVRPAIVTPKEVNLLNFALVFDQTEDFMDQNPENFPPRPKGLDKTLHKPASKAANVLNFFKKKKAS